MSWDPYANLRPAALFHHQPIAAVHIGVCIGALAGPSDVIVSSTVRDLAFDDLGLHTLKGVPGEWKLFRAPFADPGAL